MSRCVRYILVALLMTLSTTAYAQIYPERQEVRKGNSLYGSQRMEVGYASAIAFILFLIMMGANTLVNKLLSKVGQ